MVPGIGSDAVALEEVVEDVVLAVAHGAHGVVAGRVGRVALGQLTPRDGEERPHAVVAGLAVDVGEVVVGGEVPGGEQLGPGKLVHRRRSA